MVQKQHLTLYSSVNVSDDVVSQFSRKSIQILARSSSTQLPLNTQGTRRLGFRGCSSPQTDAKHLAKNMQTVGRSYENELVR